MLLNIYKCFIMKNKLLLNKKLKLIINMDFYDFLHYFQLSLKFFFTIFFTILFIFLSN